MIIIMIIKMIIKMINWLVNYLMQRGGRKMRPKALGGL